MESRETKTYEFVFDEKEAIAIFNALGEVNMASELQGEIYVFIRDTMDLSTKF